MLWSPLTFCGFVLYFVCCCDMIFLMRHECGLTVCWCYRLRLLRNSSHIKFRCKHQIYSVKFHFPFMLSAIHDVLCFANQRYLDMSVGLGELWKVNTVFYFEQFLELLTIWCEGISKKMWLKFLRVRKVFSNLLYRCVSKLDFLGIYIQV